MNKIEIWFSSCPDKNSTNIIKDFIKSLNGVHVLAELSNKLVVIATDEAYDVLRAIWYCKMFDLNERW